MVGRSSWRGGFALFPQPVVAWPAGASGALNAGTSGALCAPKSVDTSRSPWLHGARRVPRGFTCNAGRLGV